jgi:uncharacterized protein (DUF952 family)
MIYRVAEPGDWRDAQVTGSFASPDLRREGFIHCAGRNQVLGVANRYYRLRSGLVILAIDPGKLGASRLVWENTTGGAELFPHVYGLIPVSAVVNTAELEWTCGGDPVWPVDW